MTQAPNYIEVFGRKMTYREMHDDPRRTAAISLGGMISRIDKGMRPEEAMRRPAKAQLVEAWGERRTVREWFESERFTGGVCLESLHVRLGRGMAPELAITSPPMDAELLDAFGFRLSLHRWLCHPLFTAGISAQGLRQRIRSGMDPEKALTTPARGGRVPDHLAAFGLSLTLSEWVQHPLFAAGITRSQIRVRVRGGMSPEEALTRPPRDPATHDAFGLSLTVSQWAQHPRFTAGITRGALQLRLNAGMDPEEALTRPSRTGRPGRTPPRTGDDPCP